MSVKWNGPAVGARVRSATMKGLVIGIGIVESRILYLTMQQKKTGRIYKKRGRTHQASAPGEPFANDTGRTLASRTIKLDTARLRAVLIFRSANALRMERGTRKIKPRPFARRALSETATQVRDAVLGEIKTELQKK